MCLPIAEEGVAKRAYPAGFAHHYPRPDALKALAAGDVPRLIFVNSMSDLFAVNVPEDEILATLRAMEAAPQHTFLALTKAAPRLQKFVKSMPSNLMVGVSSPPDEMQGKPLSRTQQLAMLRNALEALHTVKEETGNLVWMSTEPISWDLTLVLDSDHPLDWVVIGAASSRRKYFQPDPQHVANLLKVLDATNTPVFYKGNIRALFESHDFGSPNLNRWREDYPAAYRDGRTITAVARRQQDCVKYGWTQSLLYAPRAQQTAKRSQSPVMASADGDDWKKRLQRASENARVRFWHEGLEAGKDCHPSGCPLECFTVLPTNPSVHRETARYTETPHGSIGNRRNSATRRVFGHPIHSAGQRLLSSINRDGVEP